MKRSASQMGDAMRMALEDSGPPITPVPSGEHLASTDPPSLSASPPEGGIHPALARQSRLAITHPCEREGEVKFFGGKEHRYVDAGGKEVPHSVTYYTDKYFNDFNAEDTVKQYFPRWNANKFNKYYPLIQYLRLVNELDDVAIKAEIVRLWDANGKKAADEGTAVHEEMQCIAEEWMMPEPPSTAAAMGKTWLLTLQGESPPRVPVRVHDGVPRALPSGEEIPVVAGSADLILQSTVLGKEKEFTIVDWKIINPEPKVEGGPKTLIGASSSTRPDSPTRRAPYGVCARRGPCVRGAAQHLRTHPAHTVRHDARGKLSMVQPTRTLVGALRQDAADGHRGADALEHEAKNAVEAYARPCKRARGARERGIGLAVAPPPAPGTRVPPFVDGHGVRVDGAPSLLHRVPREVLRHDEQRRRLHVLGAQRRLLLELGQRHALVDDPLLEVEHEAVERVHRHARDAHLVGRRVDLVEQLAQVGAVRRAAGRLLALLDDAIRGSGRGGCHE